MARIGMKSTSKAVPLESLKFEAALAELEQIVHTMESGKLELEASIEAYRRGAQLLKHCQQQLADAEQKIQVLENGELKDLNPDIDPASQGKEPA